MRSAVSVVSSRLSTGLRCAAFLIAAAGPRIARPQADNARVDRLLVHADSLYRAHDWAAAAPVLATVTRRHPDLGLYWYRYGVALYFLGRKPDAAVAYRRAIALKVGAVATYNLAGVYASEGQADSAFYWLDAARKGGFADPKTLAGDSDFAAVRRDPRYTTVLNELKVAWVPCLSQTEFRRFDFWAGDWDVTTQDGQLRGTSSIQPILEGCALLENWTGVNGWVGKSLNTYNPDEHMWQQFWVGQDGRTTEYRESEWRAGSLQFLARQHGGGQVKLSRLTFTPIGKDLVRQHGESSADDGKTWTTTYDFYYHRRPAAASR